MKKINKYIMFYLISLSFCSANNSQVTNSNVFLSEKRDDIHNQCLYDVVSFTCAFMVAFYALGIGVYLFIDQKSANF